MHPLIPEREKATTCFQSGSNKEAFFFFFVVYISSSVPAREIKYRAEEERDYYNNINCCSPW
jgi:hypothetical protein